MNRTRYFDYIEEKLGTLAFRINQKGKLNVLDLHMHSEDFYLHFFNELYGWKLENLNKKLHNVEAIDLIDNLNKLLIQVSATNTKKKIQSALNKEILNTFNGYTFKFISISKKADDLRKNKFEYPQNIFFDPANDIFDTTSVLKDIKLLKANDQKKIYNFIKEELGSEVDIVKLDSNLAMIINILSEEDWDRIEESMTINSFEIDRKIELNNLDRARLVIDDYKVHYNRLDKKYAEFNMVGKNKSSSVLATIRKEYIKSKNIENDNELFFHILDSIQDKATQSANYVQIPIEELEQCISIIVVDAFIRCKIFKNPDNYNYVTT